MGLRHMVPCWVTAAPTLLLVVQALALAVHASDAQPPRPRSTITLDLAKAATSLHRYDGHGAIADSGSSRLLMDYPEPQRSEILDYLFLPNFGASLHMLKVEVNGDVQSGIGTGPSHMHHRHDSGGCNRGNTAWLIREVKKRNPLVLTYGLPWGMPAWVGGGDYYSQDSIDYFISWLRCQREAANTTVDFLGLWNEYVVCFFLQSQTTLALGLLGGANYTKSLRRQLNAAGFEATKLVLLDDAPQYSGPGGLPVDFLEQFASDAEFRDAVEVVGYHYCCDNVGSDGYAALSAIKPTIRLWESEAHDGNWDKTLVTSFNNAHKTAQVDWCAIWSAYYPEFVDGGTALFWAFEPWSGHYVLDTQPGGISQIWKGAHFTQFTEPGWRYLDGANGNLSATGGGAFLALTSDVLGSNFSIMIETHSNITCTTLGAVQQTAELVFSGEWCPRGCALQMWISNATHDFLRQPDLQLAPFTQGQQRRLNLELPAATIFSISTLHTARKGQHPTPPARVPFPFPFITDFEAANDTQPKYVSDNSGSFSIETGVGKGGGSALKQRVTMNPDIGNGWINNQDPVTQFGSHNWTDYSISVDAMIVANQTMDGYADVPTAAALMPCMYGSQDRWTFSDSIISQNQTTCLSSRVTPTMTDSTAQSDGKPALRRTSMSQPTCVVTDSLMNLQLMDCKTPQVSNCGKFDLNSANHQLKHRQSGLCVTACGGQPWGCGDVRAVSAELAGAQWSPDLLESVALLRPCQPGMHTQQWKYDETAQSLMSSTGKCLSTEARQPSIRPPYTSVCSRFYFMWGNNGAPQKGYCLEAYINGSWILRGAGLPYLTMAARGSEAEAVHGQYLLLHGTLPSPGVVPGQWHALRLNASGTRISGYFNGVQLFSESNGPNGGIAALSTNGAPALASSFHEILFDNLRVEPIPPPTNPLSIVRAVSIAPGGVSSVAFSPECLTPAGCTSNAQYNYESGLAVRITHPVTVQSLGRWRASSGHQSHYLRLYNASGLAFQQNFARSSLDLVGNTSVDLSTCEPDDIGFCYARLLPSLTVAPGVYFILSEEDTAGDVVFWGKAMAAGGVRLVPMDGWVDQNEPRPESGNNGTVRLAGPVAIVNGSGSWTSDGADTKCHDTASPVCKNTTNTLCVSCTSSDWLAPSCPPSWNFQAECCATWTRQCAEVTPNLGFSAFGPVSALLDPNPTLELI